MKILKRTIWIILLIICIPLVIYNVTIFIKSNIHPNQTADFLGFKLFIVQSGSMIPTMQINDVVISKNVSEEELKKNDIITFHDEGDIVTHRIIEIKEIDDMKYYITKGDNNNTEDEKDKIYRDIEGKVVLTIPKAGYYINLLQGNLSPIIFMILIFTLFSLEYRRD